jgi:hypothetical protein
MFQMVNMEEPKGQNTHEALRDNYPPRLRALILFSSLIGSWVVVAAAGYLLVRCL